MVTSYKMRETEKGYRGSKSGLSPVKEQRVDGSWFLFIKNIYLYLYFSFQLSNIIDIRLDNFKINKNLRYTLIETNYVFYLTIYLTKLLQKTKKVQILLIEKK